MPIVACLWCETELKATTKVCPECGLHSPASLPAGSKAKQAPAVRRERRLVLALAAVPLMLTGAYAAHVSNLPKVLADASSSLRASAPIVPQPPAIYGDPLQRAVWTDGLKAVRQALAQPTSVDLAGSSFVAVAAGHVVSFCGEVPGTSGYESSSGARRFISIFGQSYSTVLEGDDASFVVLWTRVCARTEGAA